MTAKISISIAEPELLGWAKGRASLTGVSLSAVVTDAVRLARQQEAREHLVRWLGRAAALTIDREADILADVGDRGKKSRRPSGRRHSFPTFASSAPEREGLGSGSRD